MSLLDRVLDLLYPRICGLCGVAADEALCRGCEAKVAWYGDAGCPVCGGAQAGSPCAACAGRRFLFRRAIALGPYAGTLRDAVLAFKFRGERSLSRPLARRMAERIRGAGFAVDEIAFVPMSRWRILTGRRYNAAELLAEALARELRLPLSHALRKIRRTRAQVSLSLAERLENPRDAYRARGVADRAILLVDDVLTTGATASACAQALYEARAREVNVAVVARA